MAADHGLRSGTRRWAGAAAGRKRRQGMRTESLMSQIARAIMMKPRVIGLFLLLLAACGAAAADSSWVTVRWIADGDTVFLQDGRSVRYIGIDTPERARDQQKAEFMAHEARSINRQLVEGWPLRLEYDRQRSDRYQRVLAYVYRRDDGLFINAELVRQGVAHVLHQAPNTKMETTLIILQREAMAERRGIWRGVDRDEKPIHPYRGNRRSKRFHAHACSLGKSIASRNRIVFSSQWAAFWEGYAPASECIDFPVAP